MQPALQNAHLIAKQGCEAESSFNFHLVLQQSILIREGSNFTRARLPWAYFFYHASCMDAWILEGTEEGQHDGTLESCNENQAYNA